MITTTRSTPSHALGSLWVGVVVSLEELSQLYIPYRTFDLVDLLFDFVGILVAGAITRRLVKA